MVKLMLVLADDIFMVWSEQIGGPSSSQMHLGIAMISNPESRTPIIECPVLLNLPSIAQSGRLW